MCVARAWHGGAGMARAWGMATALGGLLLLATMLLYVIYSWLVGASHLRLG